MSDSKETPPTIPSCGNQPETTGASTPPFDLVQECNGKQQALTRGSRASRAKESKSKAKGRFCTTDAVSMSLEALLDRFSRPLQIILVLAGSIAVIISVCVILSWVKQSTHKLGIYSSAPNHTHSQPMSASSAHRTSHVAQSNARVILFYAIVLVVFVVCVYLASTLRETSVSEKTQRPTAKEAPVRDSAQRLLPSIPEDSANQIVRGPDFAWKSKWQRARNTISSPGSAPFLDQQGERCSGEYSVYAFGKPSPPVSVMQASSQMHLHRDLRRSVEDSLPYRAFTDAERSRATQCYRIQ